MRFFFTVLILFIFLITRIQGQCNGNLFVNYYTPCHQLDTLNLLCDFNDLDGECLDMYGSVPGGNPYFFGDACNPNPNGGWPYPTFYVTFIATDNFIELKFNVSNCDYYGTNNDPATLGTIFGIWDISDPGEFCDVDEVFISCNCTLEGDSLIAPVNVTPGRLYAIGVAGCNQTYCHVDISVLNGGPEFITDAPTAINSEATMFSTPDSICQGATNVPFSLEPDTVDAPRYLVYRNNGFLKESDSLPLSLDWNVPPGTYEVCAASASVCDTTMEVCTEVEVVEWPDQFFTDTTCINDLPYSFMGENISSGGEHRIPQQTSEGCDYDNILNLTVVNEPEPLTIDTLLCPGNSVTIAGQTFSSAGDYDITFPSVIGGCDTAATVNVEMLNASITLSEVDCNAETFTASANVTTQPTSDVELSYNWYDQSGTIVDNGSSLEVFAGGTYYVEVTVTYGNQSCIFISDNLIIEEADFLPATADLVGLEDTICSENALWWEIPEADNTENYSWSAPSDVDILEGSDSTAVLLTSDSVGTYAVCIETSNTCGDSTICRDLVVVDAVDLSVGSDTTICGYETMLSANGPLGHWTQLSGPGISMYSDSSQQATTVSVDQPGTYQYEFTATTSLCPNRDTLAVTFTDTLSVGSISYECLNATQEFVATVEVHGGTSPFSIINGSGTIDTSVFTSSPTPSGDTIFLEITDSLGCGPLSLVLTTKCDCTTDAGTMPSDTLMSCDTSTCFSATPVDDPTADSDDLIRYTLHEGSGNSLVNIISISDDSTFCFTAGMQTDKIYYISRIVGSDDGSGNIDLSDGCLSVAPGQPVGWLSPPAVEISEENSTSCDTTFNLGGTTLAGNSNWSLVSGPGIASFGNQTADTTEVAVSESGVYCFALQSMVLNCTDTDTVCVTIFEDLSFDSLEFGCTADNANYTVSFSVFGGDTSMYSVSGDAGVLGGNSFTSDLIAADSSYIFMIENTCDTITIEGSHSCACTSDAGMMDSDTVTVCRNESIFIKKSQNTTLDGNDVLVYVLHEGNASSIINPIEENTVPTFAFDDSQMDYGVVYHITAVVGNEDGNGSIDPADICQDTSNATPVIWHEVPDISLQTSIRELSCLDTISVLSTPDSASTFSYQWSSIPPGLPISDPNLPSTEISEAGSYQLIAENGNNDCADTASITITADTEPPTATSTVNNTLNCSNETVLIDATASSTGSEFAYNWSPTSGMTDSTSLQPTVSYPGTYTLVVTNTENGCTASTSVTVSQDTSSIQSADITVIDPRCVGQASGQISVENIIGGTAPYSYVLNNGQAQNTSGTFNGLSAGNYSILITDENGCSLTLDSIKLVDPDPLQVNLSASIQISIGDSAALSPLILPPMRPIENLIWTTENGDTLRCNPCDSILVQPDATTTYTLTAIDSSGCIATASVTVVVDNNRNIYIPNAFTPNGDGINDNWTVYTDRENAMVTQLAVFNKWGDRLFQASDIPPSTPQVGWDGTFRGQKLNPDVFTYTVLVEFADGTKVRRSGTVSLLK